MPTNPRTETPQIIAKSAAPAGRKLNQRPSGAPFTLETVSWPCYFGDRIELLFAAVHESEVGPSRHFAALRKLIAVCQSGLWQAMPPGGFVGSRLRRDKG